MLTDKERELLNGKNYASLATVNQDGSPQVSTVWVEADGDDILVNTARGRRKDDNMTRDPRVAISIFSMANPYDSVSIKGKVVEITEQGAKEHIDKLADKYLGKTPYPFYQGETRVIYKIKKVSGKAKTSAV